MRPIDYFDKSAARYPNRTAIVDGGTRMSYAEVRVATDRIARALWAGGLQQEERVAIYSPNDARLLLCMLGVMRAGAVWVPLNAKSPSAENGDFMAHAGAAWLFYHSCFSDTIQELRARAPGLRRFVCIDRPDGDIPALDAFMACGDGTPNVLWADAMGNPDRLLVISSTGGTTGVAKAVMVTNLSWSTLIEMGLHCWHAEEPTVCLSVAPLTHGARTLALTTFAAGGTNVIMQRFDAEDVLRQIAAHRVTHMFLPPTAFYTLLAEPEAARSDHSSLRMLILAGAPISADKLRKGVEVFGPCLGQCYGQVEAPMLLSWIDPDTLARAAGGDHPERLMSCGKAPSAMQLAIVDDAGRVLPPGERGEIVARSHLVTPGYYNNAEATAEVKAGGWHHTGDVGYVDQDGFFYIVDRKKQMIITGGFNVYAAEVESVLMELAQVQDCAVIGVPDPKWGEAIKAVVVLDGSSALSEADIISHCKARLGGVKSPKTIEFRPELPRNAVGKVDKQAIRKPFWDSARRGV